MYKTWLVIGFDRPSDEDAVINRMKLLGLYEKINPNARKPVYLWLESNKPTIGFESLGDCDWFFEFFTKKENRKITLPAFSCLSRAELEKFHDIVFRHKQMSVRFKYDFLAQPDQYHNPYHRRFLSICYEPHQELTELTAETHVVTSRKDKSSFRDNEENFLFLEPTIIDVADQEELSLLYGSHDNSSRAALLPPWKSELSSTSYLNEEHYKIRNTLRRNIIQDTPIDQQPFGLVLWRLIDDSLFRETLDAGARFDMVDEDGNANQLFCRIPASSTNSLTESKWRNHYVFKDGGLAGPTWLKAIISSIAEDYRKPFNSITTGCEVVSDFVLDWNVTKIPKPKTKRGAAAEGMFKHLELLKTKLLGGEEAKQFQRNILRASLMDQQAPSNDLATQNFIANYCRCSWSNETNHNGKARNWREFVRIVIEEFSNNGKLISIEERLEKYEKIWIEDGRWLHTPNESEDQIRMWRLFLPTSVVLKSASSNILDDENTRLDSDLILS